VRRQLARSTLAGYRVLIADDTATDERRQLAHELGTELVESPDAATSRRSWATSTSSRLRLVFPRRILS
jgi:hypothetical protein